MAALLERGNLRRLDGDDNGARADWLMVLSLQTQGEAAEAARQNGEVWTSTGQFCLPGITRKAVIDICLDNDIPIFIKDFRILDVHSADEAFVTGTFAGIIPVNEIDMQSMSSGKRGDLTFQLQNLYSEKLSYLYPEQS